MYWDAAIVSAKNQLFVNCELWNQLVICVFVTVEVLYNFHTYGQFIDGL